MSGATAKGTRFEAMVANYLVMALNSDYVERKAKNGNADQGDIAGVRLPDGSKVAIECKNRAAYSLPEWLAEARTEAKNYGAKVGVVVFKRKGVGARHMGDQFVLMGLDEFARIIKSKE